MKEYVVISRQFPFAGDWYVHAPGRNRPHKIGLFPTEEQAQEVADRINALIDKQLQKVVEAAREVCDCWDVKEHEECDEHAMQDAIDALRPLVFNDSS